MSFSPCPCSSRKEEVKEEGLGGMSRRGMEMGVVFRLWIPLYFVSREVVYGGMPSRPYLTSGKSYLSLRSKRKPTGGERFKQKSSAHMCECRSCVCTGLLRRRTHVESFWPLSLGSTTPVRHWHTDRHTNGHKRSGSKYPVPPTFSDVILLRDPVLNTVKNRKHTFLLPLQHKGVLTMSWQETKYRDLLPTHETREIDVLSGRVK